MQGIGRGIEADVARRSAGPWPGASPAPVSRRGACRAIRARRGGRCPLRRRVSPSQPGAPRRLRSGRPATNGRSRIPMLSCGLRCRPPSRGGSAIGARSTVGRPAVAELSRAASSSPSRSSSCSSAILTAGAGTLFTVAAYNFYAQGLPDPVERPQGPEFEQQTIVYDRTGKVELARLGTLRREVVSFAAIPDEMLDATTAIEDQFFWTNPGFDPSAIVSAGPGHPLGPAARRVDDHPAARPRAAPARRGLRGHDLRAQDPRDHPVDPADRGLSGRQRQAGHHHRLPEPELLRQPDATA